MADILGGNPELAREAGKKGGSASYEEGLTH